MAATWRRGQPWRTARSLDVLNAQIRAHAPHAVPPATDINAWGALADSAHSTGSDHYPHWLTGLGPVAVVTARDFPHAPRLGLDGYAITEHLRQTRDPRIKYVIFAGRVTGPSHRNALGIWIWDVYTGSSDKHFTHFHVSVVGRPIADNITPWSMPGGIAPAPTGEETMTDGWNVPLGQGAVIDGFDYPAQFPRTALAWIWIGVAKLTQDTKAIIAGQAETAQTIADLTGVVKTLAAAGTSIDTAAVLAEIRARSADVTGRIAELEAALAAKATAIAEALIADPGNSLTADDRDAVVSTMLGTALAAPALPDLPHPPADTAVADCDL